MILNKEMDKHFIVPCRKLHKMYKNSMTAKRVFDYVADNYNLDVPIVISVNDVFRGTLLLYTKIIKLFFKLEKLGVGEMLYEIKENTTEISFKWK